ncbi:hypothetical protein CFL1_00957 [Lactobacillus delbrueckii subsp. bulgaricus]|nr:hypothetical protein CFL1_00957 [Lactobacillus delbrueckii subsp. bulgaricus]
MIKSLKINISYLYFTISSLYFGFVNTPFQFSNKVQNTVLILMVGTFIFWFINKRYTIKDIVWILFLLLFALITAWKNNPVLLIAVMSAIIFSKSQSKSIFKLIFWERIILNVFRSSLSLTGVIQNKVQVAKSGQYVTGYGLGFNNPNDLAVEIGMLILLYVCVKESSLTLKNIFVIIVITAMTYRLTLCRTFLLMMPIAIGLLIGIKYLEKLKFFINLYTFISIASLGIGFIVSIGIPYVMNLGIGNLRPLIVLLNNLTSDRFMNASRVMLHYPITLFGGVGDFDILKTIYNYSIVDNGYIRLLYGSGIVGTIIVAFIYIKTITTLASEKRFYWMVPVIVFILWGISENVLCSLHWNFSILLWGVILEERHGILVKGIAEERTGN